MKAPFAAAAHWVAAVPWVYDCIQTLAGSSRVYRLLQSQIAPFRDASPVLDLGGGTGLYRDLWPTACDYYCLDIEPRKLQAFGSRNPGSSPLLADAAHIPLRDGGFAVVVCTAVAHHLPAASLDRLVGESARVLAASGVFLFMDATYSPRRALGRLLWSYDQGSYPRGEEELSQVISAHFRITAVRRFSVYHEYFFCAASKLPAGASNQ